MMIMGEKRKAKFGLMKQLLCMTLIPVIALSAILVVFSANKVKSGMEEEFLNGLLNSAYAVEAGFEAKSLGDYYLDDDGNLFKGYLNISAQPELMDSYSANSEVEYTFFYGDTRKATTLFAKDTGERMIDTQASEKVVNAVIKNGQIFEATDLVINGQPFFAAYIPHKNSDGKIIGMFFAGQPSASVEKYITSVVMSMVILSLVLVAIVCVIIIFLANKLVKALVDVEDVIDRMAEGDLTVEVPERVLKRKDEIGFMGQSLLGTITKLGDILKNIQEASKVLNEEAVSLGSMSSQTSETADEVSRAVDEISKGAVTQAEEVEHATQLVSDMGFQIEQIAQSVNGLFEVSNTMQQAGEEAGTNMEDLRASNEHTASGIEKVAENVARTDKSVESISKALEMITDIADETNLLSLNASIEAARAGDAGRGFAVVASQIQKLAEESTNSANQISQIIKTLSEDSSNTLRVTEELKKDVMVQQEKMDNTVTKFGAVNEGIDASGSSTAQINTQATECDNARITVVDIIQNLSALSEENAAATQQTTASVQQLNATVNLLSDAASQLQDLSHQLDEDIRFFTL